MLEGWLKEVEGGGGKTPLRRNRELSSPCSSAVPIQTDLPTVITIDSEHPSPVMPARKKNKNKSGKIKKVQPSISGTPAEPQTSNLIRSLPTSPTSDDDDHGPSGSYYHKSAPVTKYELVGRLPGTLVDVLHHLSGRFFEDTQRRTALLAFRGWLEDVVRWRTSHPTTVDPELTSNTNQDVCNSAGDPASAAEREGDWWLVDVGPIWVSHTASMVLLFCPVSRR